MKLKFIVFYLLHYVRGNLDIETIVEDNQGTLREDPIVQTKLGQIRGVQATDGDYSMFMGIPYAQVDPSNPFGPSAPNPAFDDVYNAYDDSAICPQVEEFNNTIVGTFDCLHLNIYVPNSASTVNPLPVLVWIYGGGFRIGFAGRHMYGPRYLVRHDIIVVTINYRVGPYGFMCLDIPEVPGNQGLKDQVGALRWINEHIDSFGGDVNRITISGNSAGAASVGLHVVSEVEPLYHKVILQSGVDISPWNVGEINNVAILRLAAQLGHTGNDVRSAVAFLSSIDVKSVIEASSEIGLEWSLCVEQDFENVEKFIGDYPINLKVPKINDMPVLLGYNDQENIVFYYNAPQENFANVVEFVLGLAFEFEDPKTMEDVVKHFYLGDKEPGVNTKWEVIDLTSDMAFVHPTERLIQKYLENNAGPLYHYVFSYVGGRNYVRIKNNVTTGGAAHTDEVPYIFDYSFIDTNAATEDQLVIDRMTAMWANFVKYGNPTPETSDLLPVKWEPVTKEIMPFLDIGTELALGYRPFHRRMTFWNLFYKVNREKQVGYRAN